MGSAYDPYEIDVKAGSAHFLGNVGPLRSFQSLRSHRGLCRFTRSTRMGASARFENSPCRITLLVAGHQLLLGWNGVGDVFLNRESKHVSDFGEPGQTSPSVESRFITLHLLFWDIEAFC